MKMMISTKLIAREYLFPFKYKSIANPRYFFHKTPTIYGYLLFVIDNVINTFGNFINHNVIFSRVPWVFN